MTIEDGPVGIEKAGMDDLKKVCGGHCPRRVRGAKKEVLDRCCKQGGSVRRGGALAHFVKNEQGSEGKVAEGVRELDAVEVERGALGGDALARLNAGEDWR